MSGPLTTIWIHPWKTVVSFTLCRLETPKQVLLRAVITEFHQNLHILLIQTRTPVKELQYYLESLACESSKQTMVHA